MNKEELAEIIQCVLLRFKPIPFACLPMSVEAFIVMSEICKENKIEIKLGDLNYKSSKIFSSNFSLNEINTNQSDIFTKWEGHAWIEIDDSLIIDLSIFRTIYSDEFTHSSKNEIISKCGQGRGCLVIPKLKNNTHFEYIEKEILTNDMVINGVLKGIDNNKEKFLNI